MTHCLNLKHPNLIALYDVKEDDQDNTWVVMEYAVGESLEEVIDRHPQGLPLDEAIDWMQGIGAGVAYLHDHGIVHRDLKPGNIFRDDGQVKLGDYGLSKFISCSRRSGQTESIGTVHYMAPEVANGRYGKEIDIYALGVILYEMLTGQVPFEGESVGEVLMKHLTAEPSLENVPEAYRTVIARALAKDPTTRFANVAEMFNAPTATGRHDGISPADQGNALRPRATASGRTTSGRSAAPGSPSRRSSRSRDSRSGCGDRGHRGSTGLYGGRAGVAGCARRLAQCPGLLGRAQYAGQGGCGGGGLRGAGVQRANGAGVDRSGGRRVRVVPGDSRGRAAA